MISHKAFETPEGYVLISYKHPFTKKQVEFTLNCTKKQYTEGMGSYRHGAMMQDAFPFLSVDEREVLISGLIFEEFDGITQPSLAEEGEEPYQPSLFDNEAPF